MEVVLNPIQIFLYNGLNGVSVFRFELKSELWFGIKSPMPICIFVFLPLYIFCSSFLNIGCILVQTLLH